MVWNGSTQPHKENWVATVLDMRSSKIQLRKLKLRLRDKRFANHKAPCTAIWQQLLQSVLALRGCNAMDLFILLFLYREMSVVFDINAGFVLCGD